MRGRFSESVHHHPMGPAILALFLFTAGQGLIPRRARDQLQKWMRDNAGVWNGFYASFVAIFVAYGLGRAIAHVMVHWTTLG